MLLCCTNSSIDESSVKNKLNETEFTSTAKSEELSKSVYYKAKMLEKNYSLKINGPCDDALEDTLHERSKVYVESQIITDTISTITFKFKAACCQEFLGDYLVKNDTFRFNIEQVNETVCSCICWYRYKLIFNKTEEKFSTTEIKLKKR